MPLIFHQNMRVYGGYTVARNLAYAGAFAAINGVTGANYWAAGFTEIRNANLLTRNRLSALAQALDPGLTSFVMVEVGTTALGTREFIGIAWDPLFMNVQHAGQVYYNAMHHAWTPRNVPAGAIVNQTINLPGGVILGADTRGVAYIACTHIPTGNPYLIGFMHNMYRLGDKSSAFTNLGTMADGARQAAGGAYVNAEVIIGGDFNLEPRPPKRPRGAALTLRTRAAVDGGGAYINTTLVHAYDYWVVSNAAITDADADIHVQTRPVPMGPLSDHAGVTLDR